MNGLARIAVCAPLYPYRQISVFFLALLTIVPALGCRDRSTSATPTVTLYSSVDEPFAREIIEAFGKEDHITVQLKLDTEAGKTTGLVNLIRDQQSHPIADVFWSSELFNTIKMAREGLLAEYRPPAEGIPERFKDPAGKWTAFGLRARVLAYNTAALKPGDLPSRWRDMVSEKWAGKLAIANPQFGTTRGHFAAMLALWGEDEYVRFLTELDRTIQGRLMDGNARVAMVVGTGEYQIGATDTDDVYSRQERKEPIDLIYPDMGDGGTLLVPNSVALVARGPHPEAARKLISFLTSPAVERMLAKSDSRNIPVRESLRNELNISKPAETTLSFDRITDAMDQAIELAGKQLVK